MAADTMITGWVPDAGQEDLRGWEWYFNLGRIRTRDKSFRIPGPVASIDFTPFGEKLAVSGVRGTEIRNPLTSALVRRFPDPKGHRKSVWSPDGRRLLTLSDDGVVEIWNPADGRKVRPVIGEDRVLDVCWGPSETMVTLHENELRRWRLANPGEAEEFDRASFDGPALHTIETSPDGRFLAAIGASPTLFLWETTALDAADGIARARNW